ncbi:MAG: LysM peptidoglycan-binding domain-containing protein [Verrucomicrobiota bacterium]
MNRSLLVGALLVNLWGLPSSEAQQAKPDSSKQKASSEGKPKPKAAAKKAEPVVAKPAVQEKYVLVSGDNPWAIAKAHGITLPELLAVNEIKDDKDMKVGDVLNLPVGVTSKNRPKSQKKMVAQPEAAKSEAAKPAAGKPAPAAETGGKDWELYTIKSGDNPWVIAKRLKVDHQKIVQLNEGLDFTKLSIGQQIKIPKK